MFVSIACLPPSDDHWNVPGWFAGFFAIRQLFRRPASFSPVNSFASQQLFRRSAAFSPAGEFFTAAGQQFCRFRRPASFSPAGEFFAGRRVFRALGERRWGRLPGWRLFIPEGQYL
jgi:hypothetical protein